MWGAVRRYEGITDPAEAGRLVDQSFVPLLEQVPGFVAYYWIDAGDGVMASLSVYDDHAGADKSVGSHTTGYGTTRPPSYRTRPKSRKDTSSRPTLSSR
jgi:hypothetical protein